MIIENIDEWGVRILWMISGAIIGFFTAIGLYR